MRLSVAHRELGPMISNILITTNSSSALFRELFIEYDWIWLNREISKDSSVYEFEAIEISLFTGLVITFGP